MTERHEHARLWRTDRRQITAVFCDLVGSTALSVRLDPEDFRDVLQAFHACCRRIVEQADGYVAQLHGDGVLAYFGYHEIREGDTQRSVAAGLRLLAAVAALPPTAAGQLQVRIGISTGIVLSEDPAQSADQNTIGAIGKSINLAARLQTVAEPGQVVVSDTTKRLTEHMVRYAALGLVALKGFDEKALIWRAVNLRPSRGVRNARGEQAKGELIHRDAELDIILRASRDVQRGLGRSILITGDAGIGKSRLLLEFSRKAGPGRWSWLEGRGGQSFSNTPFHAVQEIVWRALDPLRRLTPAQFRVRLRAAIVGEALLDDKVFDLIAGMMALPGGEATKTDPGTWRRRLFDAAADWLHALARMRPVALVIEDVHWLDPSSSELIRHLLGACTDDAVLIVQTTRPGHADLASHAEYSHHIALGSLSDLGLLLVIEGLGGAGYLSEQDTLTVLSRAEGVPLFGIELAQFLSGSGANQPVQRPIPTTLWELLNARLDQLGTAKQVAQAAAVIGAGGSLALLMLVSGLQQSAFDAALAILVAHRVLAYQRPEPQPTFAFTHALLRDAAYDGLTRTAHRALHRMVAANLLDGLDRGAEARCQEVLASHWTQAGESELALRAWHQAGDHAASRRAFQEAEHAYRQALAVLLAMPRSAGLIAEELVLRSAHADVLRVTDGYSAERTVAMTARAHELALSEGDLARQFQQFYGAWASSSSAGDLSSALKIGTELHALAQAYDDADHLAQGHMVMMTSTYRIGALAEADQWFEAGRSYFDDPKFLGRAWTIAQTYGNAARIAWLRGHGAEAEARIVQMLALVPGNGNPYDLVYAHYMAGVHYALIGNPDLAKHFALSTVTQSDKFGFTQFAAIGRVTLGQALIGQGQTRAGIELLKDGLARMAAASVRVATTMYLTWLAEAHLALEDYTGALSTGQQALAFNLGETFFRPETLRVYARAFRHASCSSDAAQLLDDAAALATHIGAWQLLVGIERDRAELRGLVAGAAIPVPAISLKVAE